MCIRIITKDKALDLSNRSIQLTLDNITVHLVGNDAEKALKEYNRLKSKVDDLGQHLKDLTKL